MALLHCENDSGSRNGDDLDGDGEKEIENRREWMNRGRSAKEEKAEGEAVENEKRSRENENNRHFAIYPVRLKALLSIMDSNQGPADFFIRLPWLSA